MPRRSGSVNSRVSMTVGRLVAGLEARYPRAWAEEWDRNGLIAGDPDLGVSRVLVTLDATAESVARAAASGAGVLVTHHPPFLESPATVTPSAGPEGALEAASRLGVALAVAHTNLDRSPDGGDALSRTLGLSILRPLESGNEEVSLVVVYVPPEAEQAVISAMAEAGAGRAGRYAECAFVSEGRGRFVPLEGATPYIPAAPDGAAEVRIEMLAPRELTEAVLEAAASAHPYEEPVLAAVPAVRPRGVARLGRVCEWRDGATLGELAAHVSRALLVSCRVWGDPTRPAGRIAVANGSGSSLIGCAASAADTLVAGEVRYHDALAASSAGLAVIEAGHDATEWPLVRVLGEAVASICGTGVEVVTETPAIGWWTVEGPDVRR